MINSDPGALPHWHGGSRVMLHFYRLACVRWVDSVPHDATLILTHYV